MAVAGLAVATPKIIFDLGANSYKNDLYTIKELIDHPVFDEYLAPWKWLTPEEAIRMFGKHPPITKYVCHGKLTVGLEPTT